MAAYAVLMYGKEAEVEVRDRGVPIRTYMPSVGQVASLCKSFAVVSVFSVVPIMSFV